METRSDSQIELAAFKALAARPGSKVLDAPCGAGSFAARLLAQGCETWSLDLDREASRVPGLRHQACDLNRPLPFPDGHFDAAISIEGIEHLENPYGFLKELGRVLKAGGRLVLTTPNIASLRSRVRFFGSAFTHHGKLPLDGERPSPMHHISLLTYPQLHYGLKRAGFSVDGLGGCRYKPVSLAYLALAPWMLAYTALAFRKEKDPSQKQANRQILRHLFSWPLLLGENLVVTATKPNGDRPQ